MAKENEQEKIYVGTVDDAIKAVQNEPDEPFSFEEYVQDNIDLNDPKLNDIQDASAIESSNPFNFEDYVNENYDLGEGKEGPSMRQQAKTAEAAQTAADTAKIEAAYQMAMDELKEQAVRENKKFTFTLKDENGVEQICEIVPASLSTREQNMFNDGDSRLNIFYKQQQQHMDTMKDRVKTAAGHAKDWTINKSKSVVKSGKKLTKTAGRTGKDMYRSAAKNIGRAIQDGAQMGR